MDYEKAYKEALKRAREYDFSLTGVCAGDVIQDIFPELKESDDDIMRKMAIKAVYAPEAQSCIKSWGINPDDVIAWLEKQGEQKPCMIQWKGNNLKDVLDFTGKSKNFDKWFKSFEEFEKYVSEHNNIFKLFNSDGSHFEVPIGAWIIKTPDGYNVASKAIFKPKPDGNVEPKFKVGDWIVQKNIGVYKVIEICKSWYEVIDFEDNHYSISFDNEHMCHLWTIEDAKDGDVLVAPNRTIFLFRNIIDNKPYSYCGIDCTARFRNCILEGGKDGRNWTSSLQGIYPATKEKRDILFQKIKEAEYEWDIDKKELKKVEQKSWSEEDEEMCLSAIEYIQTYPSHRNHVIYWLKSLKERMKGE